MARIAVGSIWIECNSFSDLPTTLEEIERQQLYRGEQLLEQRESSLGGMLEVLRGGRHEAVPLVYAQSVARGPLTADTYRLLKGEMIEKLQAALPVDGVLLPLHGSAAAETAGDLEGDLIGAIRGVVGDAVPIAASLDPHAHVTPEMTGNADVLCGLATYPHDDWYETGARAAELLLAMLDGSLRPTMAMAKVPVIVSAIYGQTAGDGPFADCMRLAKSFQARPGVAFASAFLVHPYLDNPGMGSGGLVITNDDQPLADRLARQVAELYWQRRHDFEPQTHTPSAAVRLGLQVEGGPVLLVETADCCGGGAAGDGNASLAALLDAQLEQPALVPVVDPQAAAECHRAGAGAEVTVELGHRVDRQWGQPLTVTATVERLSDGRFTFVGGAWDGRPGDMGPSAVLRCGAVQILVQSHGTYDWRDEQFRAVDLDYRAAKFVVVKNPMNYQLVYSDIAKRVLILDTPGPTPATLRNMPFRQLQRPYFPLDDDIPGIQPTLLRGR